MLEISINTIDELQILSQKISSVSYMQQLVNADKYDNQIKQYDHDCVRNYTLHLLYEQEFELAKQLYELVNREIFCK